MDIKHAVVKSMDDEERKFVTRLVDLAIKSEELKTDGVCLEYHLAGKVFTVNMTFDIH